VTTTTEPRTTEPRQIVLAWPRPITLAAVRDGLAQTIFVAERATATLQDFDPAIYGRYGETLGTPIS